VILFCCDPRSSRDCEHVIVWHGLRDFFFVFCFFFFFYARLFSCGYRSRVQARRSVVCMLCLLFVAVCALAAEKRAYVTVLTGDDYVWGARVLGLSLTDVKAQAEKVVLVTSHVGDVAVSGCLLFVFLIGYGEC
jgi:hypothetical protein